VSDMIQVRKYVTQVEDVFHEGGPARGEPARRGALCVVLRNPYAGRYVEDILPFMEALKPVGLEMARKLIAVLGGDRTRIEAYGKGAIVGSRGESEHGHLWHAPGGYAMREVLGGAKAMVPSTNKLGDAGAQLAIPLCHINASYVRSHFDTIEIGVADAPRPDEIVYILAMATGPRVHARSGGLKASEIKGEDGLR